MGSLIGREIIQTRVWEDPKAPTPPNYNFKYIYPITVFDAVHATMKEDSITLRQALDIIHEELKSKQPIFPSKPANYLMTYAGIAGAVGSMEIGYEISLDITQRTNDRMPTEKAVGDLLYKLGLMSEDGGINPDIGTVKWGQIIGRPNIYTELGTNENGVITQKATTDAIQAIAKKADDFIAKVEDDIANSPTTAKINNHVLDFNNPHNVTLAQINGVNKEAFDFHVEDYDNPHQVTKAQLGLDLVDNTADMDKPISTAVQSSFDAIKLVIDTIIEDSNNYVVSGLYDQPSGNLTFTHKDGTLSVVNIPIDNLMETMTFDETEKALVITKLGGYISKIDLTKLFIRYVGSTGTTININVVGDQVTGDQTLTATVVPKSISTGDIADNNITTELMADDAITTAKIVNNAIVTDKILDGNVTTPKLADGAITNSKLEHKAVNGSKLFSSIVDNRVLGVVTANTDPYYLLINNEMIDVDAVRTNHIQNKNVTSDKIADAAVISSKIYNTAVTTEKLSQYAVTNEKITPSTIQGDRLVNNIQLPGTARVESRPASTSNTNEIPDTRWVKDRLAELSLSGGSGLPGIIAPDMVLITTNATYPEWGIVTGNMIGVNAIKTSHITNGSILESKISDGAITSPKITSGAINSSHIAFGAVTLNKIVGSDDANMVLAVLDPDGTPVYSKVTSDMLGIGQIDGSKLTDRSIGLNKVETSDQHQRLLGVITSNTDPQWVQASNGMLADKSVDGRVLFTSPAANRILGVTSLYADAAWLQVNGEMIQSGVINNSHIVNATITKEKIAPGVLTHSEIADHTIQSSNIAPRAIGRDELFTSPLPNRVLAVTSMPYSSADWLQVTTDMIEDEAISREKIFQSTETISPYRVLGVTQANVPPEYLMVTGDFIVDTSIPGTKLEHDLVLLGSPMVGTIPDMNSYGNEIASTKWVQDKINDLYDEVGVNPPGTSTFSKTYLGNSEPSDPHAGDSWYPVIV